MHFAIKPAQQILVPDPLQRDENGSVADDGHDSSNLRSVARSAFRSETE